MRITLRGWHLGLALVVGALVGGSVAVAYAASSSFTTVRGGAIAAVNDWSLTVERAVA